MSDPRLAEGFPPADERQWRALAEKALKGASLDRLASTGLDGVGIRPLYPQTAPGHAIGVDAGWVPLGRVDHPDMAISAEIARAEIDGGAGGLLMVLADAAGGPSLGDGADLPRILDGLDLSSMALHAEAGHEGAPSLAALLAASSETNGAELRLRFGLSTGLLAFHLDEAAWREAAALMLEDAAEHVELRLFCADGRIVHNAGGSEAQELATMLADLVAQLRILEAEAVTLQEAASRISLALAADADQFATIAKLRAARLLVRRVLEACGVDDTVPPLHVETSRRMLSRRDPWVNMLRTTAAVAAAGLAGADSVSALPHTAAIGVPHPAARRLARNTQLMLLEESGLGRVGDPAAGSGYVEALTEDYCGRAWALFQEIEAKGGLVRSLRDGWLQREIGEIRDRRLAEIRTRRQPLTGISEFPWLDEPEPRLAQEGARHPGRLAPVEGVAPLPVIGLGTDFERLRERSDRLLDETGRRPTVFLAALGSLAEHSTRSGWARAAFATGGIDAAAGPEAASAEEIAKAFAESGCRIACLCGADEHYAGEGPAAARALKQAGCARLFLAGRPKEIADDLAGAGVDAFLHQGCDMIEALERAYEALADDGQGATR